MNPIRKLETPCLRSKFSGYYLKMVLLVDLLVNLESVSCDGELKMAPSTAVMLIF